MIKGHVEVVRGLESVVESDDEGAIYFLQNVSLTDSVLELFFGKELFFV